MKKFVIIISTFLCITLLSGCFPFKEKEEEYVYPSQDTGLAEDFYKNYSDEAKNLIYSFDDVELSEYVDNEGDCTRIAKLMEKAQEGGEYNICVLGGSVSAGQGATNSSYTYGYNVYSWWVENFPNAEFTYINAGLGATNPEMALYRYDRDVKPYSPALTIVDFSVNTYLDDNLKETYPALLSRLLSDGSAIIGIHFSKTVKELYSDGVYEPNDSIPDKNISDALKKFSVPTVNYHRFIWNQFEKTNATWADVGADWIHPNNAGHKLASQLICGVLENVKSNLENYKNLTEPTYPTVKSKYLTATFADANCVRSAGSFNYKNGAAPSKRFRAMSSTTADGYVKVSLPENASEAVILVSLNDFSGSAYISDKNGNIVQELDTSYTSPTLVKIKDKNLREFDLTVDLKSGIFRVYYVGYFAK